MTNFLIVRAIAKRVRLSQARGTQCKSDSVATEIRPFLQNCHAVAWTRITLQLLTKKDVRASPFQSSLLHSGDKGICQPNWSSAAGPGARLYLMTDPRGSGKPVGTTSKVCAFPVLMVSWIHEFDAAAPCRTSPRSTLDRRSWPAERSRPRTSSTLIWRMRLTYQASTGM